MSVPDSEMLIKLAKVLDIDVSELLFAKPTESISNDVLSEQLSRINEQILVSNNRNKTVQKVVAIILCIIVLVGLFFAINAIIVFTKLKSNQPPAYVINGTEIEVDQNKNPIEMIP